MNLSEVTFSLWDFSVQAIVRKSKHFVCFHNTIDPSFWCPRSVPHSEIISLLSDSSPISHISEVKLCAIEKTLAAYSCFPLLYNFTWGESSKHIFISERTLMIIQRNDPTPAYITTQPNDCVVVKSLTIVEERGRRDSTITLC